MKQEENQQAVPRDMPKDGVTSVIYIPARARLGKAKGLHTTHTHASPLTDRNRDKLCA